MRMQVDELSHIKPDVDYSHIPPIQQKRITAFVNHFVTNTVSYLNNFCQSCESRFMEFEYKIQKIEASLLILEAQLSSIPGFDKEHKPVENDTKSNDSSSISINQALSLSHAQNQPAADQTSFQSLSPDEGKQSLTIDVESVVTSGAKASEDPRFARFFKMVRVGVHEQAVRFKMQSEGFDPTILDNPDAIIPDSEEKS